jgi:hypothetical protein
MFGEAYAKLAETIFSWVTDERGLAEFKRRRKVESLKKDIRDAIARKDFNAASIALHALEQLSDAT